MGKRQHQQNKSYITNKEWKEEWGGHKRTKQSDIQVLDFDKCALSLLPFENPVCDLRGNVFDLDHIRRYISDRGTHPFTDEPLLESDLIHLNYDKDSAGRYRCPVTFKLFTNHMRIAAVLKSGYVYAYEAIKELNIKKNNWIDLMTGEPFSRKDIIILFDPKGKEVPQKKEKMELVERTESSTEKTEEGGKYFHFSSGEAAASLTSTISAPKMVNKRLKMTEDDLRLEMYESVRKSGKKGFVSVRTNYGELKLYLECDKVPETCHNFILLCKKGFFSNTKFHRLVPGFMIQGGDPSGSGKGGESAWSKPFRDEFVDELSHSSRGVLSMANRGRHTNTSQFFITFDKCVHLDWKHTVFGKLVESDKVLDRIEAVPTDASDVPLTSVLILETKVVDSPFEQDARGVSEDLRLFDAWRNKKPKSSSLSTIGKYLKKSKEIKG